MSSLRSWFRAAAPATPGVDKDDEKSGGEKDQNDIADLADAMAATTLIINDDIAGAEVRLRQSADRSAFHAMGLGLATFVSAVLGFEKDIMVEATQRLLACESCAEIQCRAARAQGHTPKEGRIYPPGSEYVLVQAEAQLLMAVISVLHESFTEAIKGFYKLRKALLALHALLALEGNSAMAAEPGSQTEKQQGKNAEKLGVPSHPVDIFVYSGIRMCLGLLLLLLSMVPPAFSRLLSVIGFEGDRARGLRLLWQSTVIDNVHGGVAGLVLLAYYNGSMAACDIVPRDAPEVDGKGDGEATATLEGSEIGLPRVRCAALLSTMRQRYPASRLWLLEEARALASDRRPREAVVLLSGVDSGCMRQVSAMAMFERAINALCTLDWPLLRDSFLECAKLNDWSHALYYYNAGCAELELYRDAVHAMPPDNVDTGIAARAATHKKAAQTFFRKAPTLAGRRKFMARQMPFDAFVTRKLAKWEARATSLGLDLADAIGASPAQEMIYLWNGSRRMPDDLLSMALDSLKWTRCTAPLSAVEAFRATPDECGIVAVSKAALLRSLGRVDEARKLLQRDVLVHTNTSFKGSTKDDYVLASAHYEAAALCWHEAMTPSCFPATSGSVEAFRSTKIDHCQSFLETVVKWEAFLLDARLGMKVQTGLDTVRWYRNKDN